MLSTIPDESWNPKGAMQPYFTVGPNRANQTISVATSAGTVCNSKGFGVCKVIAPKMPAIITHDRKKTMRSGEPAAGDGDPHTVASKFPE